MKNTIKKILPAILLTGTLLLSACGTSASSSSATASKPNSQQTQSSKQETESITLVVGASPAPHAEILEQVIPILKEQGIQLEIREFSDYVIPNTALADGSLDANYFQHAPYLEDFNEKNNTDLVSAGAIHFEPLRIYPGKSSSLEEIPEGAVIGVPNDTTNEARALHLLEAQGLIKLKDGVGFEAVPSDIVENPHNLKFTELEAATLPIALPDLDFAIINGNYAVGVGLGDRFIAGEDPTSESAKTYANIIAVRAGDENRPEIQALVQALQSDAVRDFILEKYKGGVQPVF